MVLDNINKHIFSYWEKKPQNYLDVILIITFTIIFTGFFFIHASHHRDFGYIIIALGLYSLIKNNDYSVLYNNNIILTLLGSFTLFCGLSVFWSSATGDDLFQDLKLVLIIPLIFLTFMRLCNLYPDLWMFLLRAFIISGVMTAVVLIIFKHHYLIELFNADTAYRMKGYGRLENQNYCALVYGSLILITLFEKNIIPFSPSINKLIKFTVFILCLSIILMTGSRQGLILLAGMIGLMLLLTKNYKVFLIYGSLLIAASIYLFLGTNFLHVAYNARGDSGRIDIWLAAIKQILDTPFIGQGYGHRIVYVMDYWNNNTTSVAHHAHSLYLSTAVRTGLIGLTLLLLCLGKTMIDLSRDKAAENKNSYFIFLISGASLGLIDGGGYFFNLGVEYLYFWFPVAAYYGQRHIHH